MQFVHYRMNILGMKAKEGTLPLSILKEIADALLRSSEKVLRLVIEGSSIKGGKTPKWLCNALDFEITGIMKGSTVLGINAPILKETVPEYFSQKKQWEERIHPNDTAISLVSKSIHDIRSGNLNSEFYDYGVLKSLQMFQTILKKNVTELSIESERNRDDRFSLGKFPNKPLPSGISAKVMQKNDLWIAASASALKATLITIDRDFDHINHIYLNVIYVDKNQAC